MKLTLILLGLSLLYIVSKTSYSLIILCIFFVITFSVLKILEKVDVEKNNYILKVIEKFSVPIGFLIILILNLSGKINTLTGINYEKKDYILFLALPFYVLSCSALISDYCLSLRTKKFFKLHWLDLALYIVLPFKLLSGPIENTNLIEKFNKINFTKNFYKIFNSFSWIILGSFMKFVIANRLVPVEMISFTNPFLSFLCAAIFELKFYFDFAGYSLIAYGIALLFNIKLTLNFNSPFTSPNVVLFSLLQQE